MGSAPPIQDSLRMQEFEAAADEPILIGVVDTILSYPFFRWSGTEWVDATGDFDLQMVEPTKLRFTNRRSCGTRFAYRYFSVAWLAKRLGKY